MEYDVMVYAGRFQLFHNGHMSVLERALSLATKVVIVLGSAHRSRSPRFPFSDTEREEMIRTSVRNVNSEWESRLVFRPVRDFYDSSRWVGAVRAAVGSCTSPGDRIGMIGHLKDCTSVYLHDFPGWDLVQMPSFGELNATDLRRSMFSPFLDRRLLSKFVPPPLLDFIIRFRQSNIFSWLMRRRLNKFVPPPVLEFITRFRQSETFWWLMDYHDYIQMYQQSWAAAPYKPTFVTTDALVRCGDKILLIRRARHPGKGMWAMPGGFIEQDELVLDGAVRELVEETGLRIEKSALLSAIKGSTVLDHPLRSERGRTVSHLYYFELECRDELPVVSGQDDAIEARWVDIGDLQQMEQDIFEDHLAGMERFLFLPWFA